MKRGLKELQTRLVFHDQSSSNLCPDEKGTESSRKFDRFNLPRWVATYAAMKSGLKVTRLLVLRNGEIVATYAAMKSGLKGCSPLSTLTTMAM